jgi:hypothetical protein
VNLFVGASLLIFDCFAFDSGGLGFAQMSLLRVFQSSNASKDNRQNVWPDPSGVVPRGSLVHAYE